MTTYKYVITVKTKELESTKIQKRIVQKLRNALIKAFTGDEAIDDVELIAQEQDNKKKTNG